MMNVILYVCPDCQAWSEGTARGYPLHSSCERDRHRLAERIKFSRTREYEPHKAMVAALVASAKVRAGFWIRGAPSHVLAEFLTVLQQDGWELRRR